MFLDAFSSERRKALLRDARRRHFPSGTTIFAAGSESRSMLLLETGRVTVMIHNSDGRRTVLGHLGPGDLLGEYALFDHGLRSADVVTASDTTGLERGYDVVREALLAEPEAMMALLSEVSRKARDTLLSLESFSHKHGAPRLAQCILRLAEKWGKAEPDRIVIAQGFSQGDLGDIAGLARENVNRLLRSWSDAGILALTDGQLTITDRRALAEIAQVWAARAGEADPSEKNR